MPNAEATIKGHITQIRNNTRSKTTNKKIVYNNENTDPIQEQNNSKTELVIATVD